MKGLASVAVAACLVSACSAYSPARGNLNRQSPARPIEEEYPVTTFDSKPPKARQIIYEEGVPDVYTVNTPGEQILPESQNEYGEYVIVNTPNAKVRNFGTNPHKNVLINNASGKVEVQYSEHKNPTAQFKTFDNTGTVKFTEAAPQPST